MARPERGAKVDIDRLFHALGDPTRRRMVEVLSERPRALSALAEPFGMTLTAVSQHLRVLEEAGIVRSEKIGRVRTCRIEPQALAVLQTWVADRRSLWERRLDQLGVMLSEPD